MGKPKLLSPEAEYIYTMIDNYQISGEYAEIRSIIAYAIAAIQNDGEEVND